MTDEHELQRLYLESLTDLAHVRERPSMYIGDTTSRGLHHLALECIGYATNRRAQNVHVSLNADGSLSVRDDGSSHDLTTLERSMTDLKFDYGFNVIEGGLHGTGVVVVNFLSAWCKIESNRAGKTYRQSYELGVATEPASESNSEVEDEGMTLTFAPDATIFPIREPYLLTREFQFSVVEKRLRELAYLQPGIRFMLVDERTRTSNEFFSDNGAPDYVAWLNEDKQPLHPEILSWKGEAKGIRYDIALQYCKPFRSRVLSYGNDVKSREGGDHLKGFQNALVRCLRDLCAQSKEPVAETEDIDTFFDGLTAVVTARMEKPTWQGATRTRLEHEELASVIEEASEAFLRQHFAEHPDTENAIVKKLVRSAKWRTLYPSTNFYDLSRQQARLDKPGPDGRKRSAWFPEAYRSRIVHRNGGEVRAANSVWTLFSVRDESDEESAQRTKKDVVEQSLKAHAQPGIPDDALVIAENESGDLLLFKLQQNLKDYQRYADELYRWDHESSEIQKIADNFDEVCWGIDPDEISRS